MNKGDLIKLNIIDMSKDGDGIGKVEVDNSQFTFFVSNAIFGETVNACITELKKNYGKAKKVSQITPSPYELKETCPYINKCGGCGYGKLEYSIQLKLKEKQVKDKLERIAKIDNPKLNPIIPSKDIYNYRNKGTIFIYDDIVGFKEKKSNIVVDCKSCMIQDERIINVGNALREFIKKYNLKGVFDSIVCKVTSDEVMVKINTKSKKQFNLEELAYLIDDSVDNTLESLYIDDKLVAGKATILSEITGLKFEISPNSFYQVNTKQMVNLYNKAIEYLDVKSNDIILDLYCGVGTIGIFILNDLAKKENCKLVDVTGKVIGIEIVKDAIIDANRNAVINGIVNARYIVGKAEDELPIMLDLKKNIKPNEVNELVEKEPEIRIDKVDSIILDPPRLGCDKELLDSVIKINAKKVVYISCDPGTLARDINYLIDNGYQFIEGTPVDMFPNTTHVEMVCLLSKLSGVKNTIDVKVDMEEHSRIKENR